MPRRSSKTPKKRKPGSSSFVRAIIGGDIKRVREMQRAGAPINKPDPYGWLPIHRAASNDRDEIIRLMVKWGSPLEARGTEGWTPLHLAAVSMSSRAVAALLEAGADVNARSVFGVTPLHLAISPTITEKMLETVQTLVSGGAAIDARDDQGKTPVQKVRELALTTTRLHKILEDANQA